MTICQIPPTASIGRSVAMAQLITALDGSISRAVAFLQSWKDAATENYTALTTGVYVHYILRYFKDLLSGSSLMALWLKPSQVGVSQAMATLIWCAPHCNKFGRHCQAPPLRLHFNQTLLKEKSTTPCTPLNHWLSVWVVCLQFSAHMDISDILLYVFV